MIGLGEELGGLLFLHLTSILAQGSSVFNIKCRVVAISAPNRMRVSQKKKINK